MPWDVEFLPVGEGERAGDAIVVSYNHDTQGRCEVAVIDGGTLESGQAVVDHIQQWFPHVECISHVISTHPDNDHASGLRTVLENLPVANLWMHRPWQHSAEMLSLNLFDGTWSVDSLTARIRKDYSIIAELETRAIAQATRVLDPFQGARIGPFTVLSPSREVYLRLVPQFRDTPPPNEAQLKAIRFWIGKTWRTHFAALGQVLETGLRFIVPENWWTETLRDGGVTHAENESSTILLGTFDGKAGALLTGDAGRHALTWACDYADAIGLDVKKVAVVQVPHHGSRSNVSPDVLDRVVGPLLPEGSAATKSAIVSVPKDDAKHPRRVVSNAFLRRGAPVYKTQGAKCRQQSGLPGRPGYGPSVPFPLHSAVEAYD